LSVPAMKADFANFGLNYSSAAEAPDWHNAVMCSFDMT
jgi:hypothetical protein